MFPSPNLRLKKQKWEKLKKAQVGTRVLVEKVQKVCGQCAYLAPPRVA